MIFSLTYISTYTSTTAKFEIGFSSVLIDFIFDLHLKFTNLTFYG